MTPKPSAWTGLLPVDDTALFVSDTGGSGPAVVYLNGAYADQTHWRRVIADLGSGYRHITYDMRARGRSKRSADYSFETAIRDLDAVLRARGVERSLVVGWSYGGILAWHWADRNPDRARGLVTVDAFPHGLTGEAGRARIRKLFGQMRWMMPLARALRLTAQMTTDQHIDVNIDANEIGDASGPLLERLTCPVRFVLATGDSLGTSGGEMDEGRKVLGPILAHNPNVRVSAKVASNHTGILRKDFRAVADAVRELAVSPIRQAA
ncbi:MAG: alpha/beta fold hydrolase [Phenylobacterium sp.]